MNAVQPGPVGSVALVGPVALAGPVPLVGPVALGVALACAVVVCLALAVGLARHRRDRLGPADKITLTRALLACAVAGLTAQSFGRPQASAATTATTTVVLLASVALVLDGVDGAVARRTGTVSALGARFDMETDAFLIAVLSVPAALSYGPWVLAIGAARYVFVAAGWVAPWLRGPLPPRYWRKVVAAVQGVVLTVAAAHVLPAAGTRAALAVALILLAESFGRDVVTLWRARRPARPGVVRQRLAPAAASALAMLLVWAALVAPDRASDLRAGAFLAVPLEGLVLLALVVALPSRAARRTALLAGLTLGALTVVRLLDLGFSEALGRPFDPLSDLGYLGSAAGLVGRGAGRLTGAAVVTVAAAIGVGLLVLVPASILRLARLARRHRAGSRRALVAGSLAWAVCASVGLQTVPGVPVAGAGAAELVRDHTRQVREDLRDARTFGAAAAHDPFRSTPGADLLTALRGKDVLVVFVESYGRVALADPALAAAVHPVLARGTARLGAAGFSTRSAFLTSPTFGGTSWLAHSTLQTGLWIDSQARYDRVVSGDRLTLSAAFRRAGWRTVDVVPANRTNWPVGTAFYHDEQVYDARTLRYTGPASGYATMPDQYTLAALRRLELAAPQRRPVMAEVDLVSSHVPWAPPPALVGWADVGDGSVFGPAGGSTAAPAAWRDPAVARPAYASSIAYSLGALVSFALTYGDDHLVLLVLGDHQPSTVVTGAATSHDVPVTVIARDPAVTDRISGWHWSSGLEPTPASPVWRMDTFRDRFLTAFGPAGPAPADSGRAHAEMSRTPVGGLLVTGRR